MSGLLFVYGTLRGELAPAPLPDALAGLRRVGPARLPGRLYDLGSYPAAIPAPGCGSTVCGEVLELPDEPDLLARLDAYEGSAFARAEHRVLLDSGQACRCWVYAYARDPGRAPLVPNGDYLASRSRA